MIPASERWGPFALDLDPCERRARCRSMRALARLYTGPRGVALDGALAAAEDDDGALETALGELNRLAPTDKRKIWSSYAALTRPRRAA